MEQQPPAELPEWQQGLLAGEWAAFWDSPAGAEYTPEERAHAERLMDARALGAAFAGRRAFRYELRLNAVRCPALLYEGGDDNPDGGAGTAAALGTSIQLLPGLDHNGCIVAAERVWHVVAPFLRAWAAASE
jgi:hypothetical protein